VIAVVVLRFAVAIVFDALAFTVWDVGTRPPTQLARDIVHGVRTPTLLVRGLIQFAFGIALLFLAAEIARPAMPTLRAFMLIETGMLIAALLVENLVGPDLRRRLRTPA
jgi:HAMP domain-containing protein